MDRHKSDYISLRVSPEVHKQIREKESLTVRFAPPKDPTQDILEKNKAKDSITDTELPSLRPTTLADILKAGGLDEAKKRVRRQDHILGSIGDDLYNRAAGIGYPNRPIGCKLITGPTGCGKTFIAETVAQIFFGRRIVSVQCEQLSESHATSKIFGPPPGYVGYDASNIARRIGQMEQNGGGVLLLDEIEKAHRNVHQSLLGLFEKGRLTDSATGRVITMTKSYIICTSNCGVIYESDEQGRPFGFGQAASTLGTKSIPDPVRVIFDEEAVRKQFSPEFLNRIGDPLFAKPLDMKDCETIAREQLRRIPTVGLRIDFDPEIANYIVRRAYSPMWGARQIGREIDHLISFVSKRIVHEEFRHATKFFVGFDEGDNIVVEAR